MAMKRKPVLKVGNIMMSNTMMMMEPSSSAHPSPFFSLKRLTCCQMHANKTKRREMMRSCAMRISMPCSVMLSIILPQLIISLL